MIPEPDRTLKSRYEMKYVVPDVVVPSLRRLIQPFLQPDAFSVGRPGLRYSICSLYFDSADYALCRMTQKGIKNRFKMRIRSYSDDAGTPAFCEIKRRADRVVLKRRSRIPKEGLPALLANRWPDGPGLSPKDQECLLDFQHLRENYGLGPVLRVRYEREAYVSASGEPMRVTFDTALTYAPTASLDLSMTRGEWGRVDVGGTIVEVKFTDRFPTWLHDMVTLFALQKRSVPKYVMCAETAEANRRGSGLEAARPARRLGEIRL